MSEEVCILIVDDEEPMRTLLSLHLKKKGYQTEEAASGLKAVAAVQERSYNLILLDVMMPGMSGWDVCAAIRRHSDVPIIMLTARDQTEEKVKGLELGADDYITKPFEREELLARVQAQLRRSARPYYSSASGLEVSTGPHVLARGGLVLDTACQEARYEGVLLTLTRKEYELLRTFMKRPGQVFTRDDLLALIWGNQEIEDMRTVDSHVKNVREKLRAVGAPAHELIKTVWGTGYKMP